MVVPWHCDGAGMTVRERTLALNKPFGRFGVPRNKDLEALLEGRP